MEQESFQMAIEQFTEAIRLDPEYSEAFSDRCDALMGLVRRNAGRKQPYLEQADSAMADCDKAINLNPDSAHAYETRGNVYHHLKQYVKAIQDYEQAIKLDAGFAEAYDGRGYAMRRMKMSIYETLPDIDKAINLEPDTALYYYHRGQLYSTPDATPYYYRLRHWYSAPGSHLKAVRDFDRAIALNPGFVEAYSRRCVAYRQLKQYGLGMTDCDKATELDPDYVYAYWNRAAIYTDLRQYEQVIQNLDRVIELDPDDPGVYNDQGVAYLELGDDGVPESFEDAVQAFTKAIALDPTYARAYWNRADAYSHQAVYKGGSSWMNDPRRLEKMELAKADLAEACRLKPGDYSTYQGSNIC